MRISDYSRYALGVCAAAMLAACGSGSAPLGPSTVGFTAERTRPSVTYEVLYSFGSKSGDAEYPYADLINVNGKLYGTTYYGGAKGDGTVFSITPSGKETVLHSFGSKSGDGEYPYAGLINVNGTLYGTTYYGGAKGDGTVFSITPSGKETVLHSFGSKSGDGEYPYAGLINVNGTLYGTTYYGGAKGDGSVFSITPSGKETVLHSFGSKSGDGEYPYAGLINVKGTIYGTTYSGGAKRRRNHLLDHAVRQGNRAPQLWQQIGRRRIPARGPHQRQRHALRHHLLWRGKGRWKRLLDHAVRQGNRAP